MSVPSSGITANVIREMMPPYHLSPDLLEATLAALPPPPPDAPAAWRQARITRLMQEVSTLMPANAAQARRASEIRIVRELADAIAARAYAPDLTVPQMCRVGRTSAELGRTATGMVRALERSQQMPAPFFGTVLADGVDIAAVDAGWGQGTARPEAETAVGASEDLTAGTAAAGMAGSTPGSSVPPGHDARWQALVGQGLPAMTGGAGTAVTVGAGATMTTGKGADMTIGTTGEKADIDFMNRESAPEATATQDVGAAA
jgi:hypothetical protein